MAQWVNCLQKNIFVNAPPLPILCEISGAHNRVLGWLADEIQLIFENFKVHYRSKVLTFLFV